MARRIIWTEVAVHDLEQAAEYIARDSPRYAAALVRQVRDAVRSLSHLAERGRNVLEFADPTVREVLVHRYRLIYRVGPRAISIVGPMSALRKRWADPALRR